MVCMSLLDTIDVMDKETKVKNCLNHEHCHNEAANHRRYCQGCRWRKSFYGDPSHPAIEGAGRFIRKPQSLWTKTSGYVQAPIYPDHPLYAGSPNIMQHRLVLFDKIGYGPHQCHWCQEHINWGNGLEVDHLDWDRQNNDPDNLVAACSPCNKRRKKWI